MKQAIIDFRALVAQLEKHFGEKAIYHKYNESTGGFDQVAYKDYPNEMYNVYVADYSVKDRGAMILKYDMSKTKSNQVLKWKDGFYGFSHRAGCTFNIGDRLFDENFVLDSTHPKWEEYKARHEENVKEDPEWYGKFEDHVMDYVNFKERGSKVIETEEECYQSALNFAKHVS